MLDWKILASAFIAILVVAFIFSGGFGTAGFFSDTVDGISEWFGSSPFGDFVSNKATGKPVVITLSPPNFSYEVDEEIDIKTRTSSFTGFKGTIDFNLDEGTIILSEKGSQFKATIPSSNVTIPGLSIKSLEMEGIGFKIEPDISTDNGTINIKGFFGTVSTMFDSLILHGNVSQLSATMGDLEWELK